MTYQGFETVQGWCPACKAERLTELARGKKLCVEIGVFGGQSFFAIAFGSSGLLYAIDPWSASEAAQKVAPDAEKAYNWEQIYRVFRENLKRYEFDERTTVLRMTSEAATYFVPDGIDLLSLDANHDADKALWDVQNWLPKLAPGAVVVLDDTNWPSIREAAEFLRKKARVYTDHGTWAEAVMF